MKALLESPTTVEVVAEAGNVGACGQFGRGSFADQCIGARSQLAANAGISQVYTEICERNILWLLW